MPPLQTSTNTRCASRSSWAIETLWTGSALTESLEPLKPGQAGEWAVMCGSGVTACHLALSARIAGLPAPRLYVGSWSEWLRQPGRGVGTGDS